MRIAVVTGAGSGPGRALATRLRAQGDHVIGVDLAGATIRADLSRPEGRAAALDAVAALTPTVDLVMAAAAIAAPSVDSVALNHFGAVAILEGLRPLLLGSDSPRAVLHATLPALPTDEELVRHCLAGDEHRARGRAAVLLAEGGVGTLDVATAPAAAAVRWVQTQAPTPEWAGCGIRLHAVGPGATHLATRRANRPAAVVS